MEIYELVSVVGKNFPTSYYRVNIMKKITTLIMALALALGICSISSYAYYTRTKSIPSVRITVNTGDLELGDDLSDNADAYISISDENQYYEIDECEWLDDVTQLKVGDSPRIQVTLSAIPKETESYNYSTIYLFRGSYNSSNVSIKKGTLIAADTRDSGYSLMVTLRINEVKGTFDAPTSANWSSSLGYASWETDYNDSGYYDIYCYRGSKVVKKLLNYKGNSYNFYPYMTEAGDYAFKVRTVPASGSVGKSSEWTESGILAISKNQVSDGSGQTTADENGGIGSSVNGTVDTINGQNFGGQYGWITQGNAKYFRYPDGKIATGWIKLEDKYYHFDTSGKLQKGWYQNQYGAWFYLDTDTGVMKTGWLNINGNYYYLKTEKGDNEGSMSKGLTAIDGKYYFFNDSGMMYTGWRQINGAYYYFYPQGTTGGAFGYMATNTKVGDFTVGADGAWRP